MKYMQISLKNTSQVAVYFVYKTLLLSLVCVIMYLERLHESPKKAIFHGLVV